jgi:hypothetical protein
VLAAYQRRHDLADETLAELLKGAVAAKLDG